MVDLSSERLDELAARKVGGDGYVMNIRGDELRDLVAMARGKQAAERERDALRGHISEARRLLAQDGVSPSEKWDWLDNTRHLAQSTTADGEGGE